MARKTQLHGIHSQSATMGEFAGFSMPLWYKGIAEEHMGVRNSVGFFDISHMSRFILKGRDATKLLSMILCGDLAKVDPGRAFYSLMCNERGGIIDDVVVMKRSPEEYVMVCNSSNREKDWSWIAGKVSQTGLELGLVDISEDTAMLAIQGPKAEDILQRTMKNPLRSLKRFSHIDGEIHGIGVTISRTGYTGEDGFELIIKDAHLDRPQKAEKVWALILSEGKTEGMMPCGLGARDTLRLEAGFCLYGQDIDEDTTPLEANLNWVVSFGKGEFIGRDALLRQRETGFERLRVGLTAKGKGIPRTGCSILKDEKRIGRVTSGTYSPLLSKGIAMGYIPKSLSREGEEVKIEVRGNLLDAIVTSPPFYDTSKYGWKRLKQ